MTEQQSLSELGHVKQPDTVLIQELQASSLKDAAVRRGLPDPFLHVVTAA